MLNIPLPISRSYDDLLSSKNATPMARGYYRKWLRFYLDFCFKYQYDANLPTSLPAFITKLSDRKQSIALQQQSTRIKQAQDQIQHHPLRRNQLKSEIELRHCSPKTLKAYRSWIRHFQGFLKSKDPTTLTQEDVKTFLSYLASERKVAASTQNQAFNSLLFLYRHVLATEFGQMEGITRAKKTEYIPVVLSRKEIDQVLSHLSAPYDLAVKLMYGCGLRLSECLNLRIMDFNFDANILTIHNGNGSFQLRS